MLSQESTYFPKVLGNCIFLGATHDHSSLLPLLAVLVIASHSVLAILLNVYWLSHHDFIFIFLKTNDRYQYLTLVLLIFLRTDDKLVFRMLLSCLYVFHDVSIEMFCYFLYWVVVSLLSSYKKFFVQSEYQFFFRYVYEIFPSICLFIL